MERRKLTREFKLEAVKPQLTNERKSIISLAYVNKSATTRRRKSCQRIAA